MKKLVESDKKPQEEENEQIDGAIRPKWKQNTEKILKPLSHTPFLPKT
jgi:hypothetical protein